MRDSRHVGALWSNGHSSFRRWGRSVLWGSAVLLAIWIGLLAWNWPFSRKAVMAALEKESGRGVRIGSFHSTLFPPGYSAETILFLKSSQAKRGRESITVRRWIVIARWLDILLLRKRIEQASIIGLRMKIVAAPPEAPGRSAAKQNTPPRFVEIGRFKLDDAVFAFLSTPEDAQPFTITLQSIAFDRVNDRSASPFHALLQVNEPKMVLRTEGQVGPWDWKDPGRTLLSGSFVIEQGDLSVLGGIGGLFTGNGRFRGPLRQVACNGTLDVPQFRIESNPDSTRLLARVGATVNGLNGDTILNRLESRLNHTSITAEGEIKADLAKPGKRASLHLRVDRGRVEDFLSLFAHSGRPAMTGEISMWTNVSIPPGAPGFLEKVKLSGEFDITEGRFTNAQTQTGINHLSKSAEGMSKGEEKTDPSIILSHLRGEVVAERGTATLSHAALTAPGAKAVISGTCSLVNKRLNLHGLLTTTGKLADTTSGLKTALLKVATPFWKKKAMTVVPFTISGTTQHPAFALELLRK